MNLNVYAMLAALTKRPNILLIVAFLWASFTAQAQFPFNGFVIEEVQIPANLVPIIQAEGGFPNPPRTWRVYVCMDSDEWELQAWSSVYEFGNLITPLEVRCTTCTGPEQFYHTTGYENMLGQSINPALFPFLPQWQYTSYGTLGPLVGNSQITWVSGDDSVRDNFEAGQELFDDSPTGSGLFGFWNPPSTQGKRNADQQVLIFQLTTDGIFTGNMTLQFRRLDAMNNPFIPITIERIDNTFFTNQPGMFEETCPQPVFLPVNLIDYTAQAGEKQVNLNWQTASETNSDYFVIDRSSDMQEWSQIGTLPAAGNSSSMRLYFMRDIEPLAGVSYYRLRQYDINGEESLSEVRAVEYKGNTLIPYPNPTQDIVRFRGDVSSLSRLRLYDGRGAIVYEQMHDGDSDIELDLNNFARGTYMLEAVTTSGEVIIKRIQKQ
jgi:hypothetical protein